jgi:KDO2-lipid IV(A) lauroyltransferase
MRRLQWRLEAVLVRGLLALSRALGPVRASGLGGALARTVGPLLPVSRIGLRNLELAFPGSDPAWRRATLRGVWDNLGRTALEIPHVPALRETASGPGWELQGRENLPAAGRMVMVSAHLANWEMLPQAAAQLGIRLGGFYRAPDNPLVDSLLLKMREGGADLPLFRKGARGTRLALRHLSTGAPLGLLVDQKLNEGMELDFLGHPAMTTTAAAELALRFECPLIPVRLERLGPARLRLVVEPPLPLPPGEDRQDAARQLSQQVNDRIGAWVRARPAEWLWLHRRFPARFYRRG